MATKKASDSNLTGKKYNDASAGTSKIVDIPDKPTITSVSEVDSTYLRVAFSPSNTGGVPANYVTTASPGGATVTGNSPANFTTLTEGTSYTFTVVPKTSDGTSGPTSNASNSATMPLKLYSLSQTFNTSGNFTVPSGKTKIAIVGAGSGAGGGGSGPRGSAGGAGGGGAIIIVEDINTNGGTNYAVTIGSAGTGGTGNNGGTQNSPNGVAGNSGGSSSFGNLVIFNGGSGGNGGYFTVDQYSNPSSANGNTGSNGSVSYNTGTQKSYSTNGGTINSTNNQISSFTGGGSGLASSRVGGGGAGGASPTYYPGNGDWGGGNPGGTGSSARILVYVK